MTELSDIIFKLGHQLLIDWLFLTYAFSSLFVTSLSFLKQVSIEYYQVLSLDKLAYSIFVLIVKLYILCLSLGQIILETR